MTSQKEATVLGAADGVTIALGLLMSLRLHQPAILHAALGAGLAELVGMSAALWLSDSGRFWPAVLCGTATAVACIAPAVPYIWLTGWVPLVCALLIAIAIGAVIVWLRPDVGLRSVAETYGVLAVTAVLCFGVSYL
jgi:hypothetical protein